MKMVWITGGTGFFGGHIASRLKQHAIVTTRAQIDLLDANAVASFVDQGNFSDIVHAAGFVGGMQLMRNEPERMYEENVSMGRNLIGACGKKRGIHLTLIGTALSYPELAPIPRSESSLGTGPMEGGSAAYGEAKLELLRLAQKAKGRLSFTYLIPTNLYGPGNHLEPERSNAIASLFLRAIEAKKSNQDELVVWGTGEETRDFLFVEDAAKAVETAIEMRLNGEVLNLGSGAETSIAKLACSICDVVGFQGKLVFDPAKGGGGQRRCLNTSHTEKTLGFKATTSLEIGLKKTYDWVKTQI